MSIYIPPWANNTKFNHSSNWNLEYNHTYAYEINFSVFVTSLFTCFDAIPSLFYTAKAGKEGGQVIDTFLADFPS